MHPTKPEYPNRNKEVDFKTDYVLLEDVQSVMESSNRKSVLLYVDSYIIVTEFCERLAYYGFAGSLILFFQTQLGLSNSEADIQYSYWSGACYITPLIGGYIADTYLGRYKSILIFSTIYLIGLVLVVIGAVPGHINAILIYLAMYIIAIGTGGIKPNVSTLGADQFDENYEQDKKEKESFFNWFYWAINFGALLSYTVVAYICQYGIQSAGGEKWGFFNGYLIPTIMMGIAILIFLAGTRKYKLIKPSGSILGNTVNIILHATLCYLRSIFRFLNTTWKRYTSTTHSHTHPNYREYDDLRYIQQNGTNTHTKNSTKVIHLLDRAKHIHGGMYTNDEVDAVKLVTKLTPFLFAMIPYWGIYSQMSTVFQNQGCQMNLYVGTSAIPVSALNIFDTLAILLLLPLFDRFIYPLYSTYIQPITMLQKIGAGFFFALLSMLTAALVEYIRLQYAPVGGYYENNNIREHITPCQNINDYSPYRYQQYAAGVPGVSRPAYCNQICDDTYLPDMNVTSTTYTTHTTSWSMYSDIHAYIYLQTSSTPLLNLTCIHCDKIPQMSQLNVLWQIPQFIFIGISEILTSITSLEFFYSQAPDNMRSVIQSLNLATSAIGSFILIPIIYLVNSHPENAWLPVNIDEGHLIWYFLLLGGLMGLNMIYFYTISKNYSYKSTMPYMTSSNNEANLRSNSIDGDNIYENLQSTDIYDNIERSHTYTNKQSNIHEMTYMNKINTHHDQDVVISPIVYTQVVTTDKKHNGNTCINRDIKDEDEAEELNLNESGDSSKLLHLQPLNTINNNLYSSSSSSSYMMSGH